MPTALKAKGYRFFFFSMEGIEPPHIHVEKAESYAKFWLNPVELGRNHGFRSHELTEIRKLIDENKKLLMDKWNEHFNY